ncbi:D-glutamate cyclase family protein [Chelativorans alearense]|uniref:D-glutamate cyclase family protein n=1 Tax=Chelativorans alearense TaxID=2681495 RepID=UPI001FE6874D|nr:DUF1445 domain-containing protein [Chelativorans alearense]
MTSVIDDGAFSHRALLRSMDAGGLRGIIRHGGYEGQTAGLAPGRLQASLIILPCEFAGDFLRYCKKNPKPLPLIGVSRAGVPAIPQLGDVDLRTDVPRYEVYRRGIFEEGCTDIRTRWRDDFAAFAIGASITFEHALAARGVELRPMRDYKTLPMFRTSIPTTPAGPFSGNLVVSMRAVRREDVDKVRAVTARFPHAHGAPIHVGNPAAIGIADLDNPDWGDALAIGRHEVPVFWASGATARDALQRAAPRIYITHSPGHMLLTDVDGRSDIGSFKAF